MTDADDQAEEHPGTEGGHGDGCVRQEQDDEHDREPDGQRLPESDHEASGRRRGDGLHSHTIIDIRLV